MTLATTIANVRRIIEEEPYQTTVSAQVSAGATSMSTTASGADWKEGDIVEEQGAGEQFLVTADGTGNSVSIRKGYNNTTDTTVASGTVIVKGPENSYAAISQAISEIVESLWPEVYVVPTTTITPSTTADLYEVPSAYEGFIDLQHTALGSITDIVRPWRVEEVGNVSTSLLSSGKGIRVYGWGRTDTAATLTYKAQATTTNMPSALERIVAQGVAAKLLKNKAAQNSFVTELEGQGTVRNLLQSARFLEDAFKRQKDSYAASIRPEGQVRRWVRPRVISG